MFNLFDLLTSPFDLGFGMPNNALFVRNKLMSEALIFKTESTTIYVDRGIRTFPPWTFLSASSAVDTTTIHHLASIIVVGVMKLCLLD